MATDTAYNLGPLTTEFPVPKTCTSTFLGDNGQAGPGNVWIQFGTVGPSYQSDCFPDRFQALDPYYYSPGVCPRGYTVACAAGLGDGATVGTCCPTGYGCVRGRPGHESNACRTVLATDSYFSYSVALTTATDDYPRPQSSTTQFWAAGAGVFARGPVIRRSGGDPSWPGFPVQTDESTTTAAATSKSTKSGPNQITGGAEITPTPTGMPSSSGANVRFTTVTQPASPGGNGGISEVAKIGIGVGVAVGVAALVAVGVFVWWRQKRSLKRQAPAAAQQQQAWPNHNYYPPSGPHQLWYQQQQQAQKYAYPQVYEKPANSGPWMYPEAQGNPVSELDTHPVDLAATRR